MKQIHTHLLLAAFLLFSAVSIAQPLYLKRIFPLNPNDLLHSSFLLSRPDNSVLDFGMVDSKGIISKLDSTGKPVWAKTYLFNSNTTFDANFIDATNSQDSSFAVVALVSNNSSIYTTHCIKLKANGDTLWCRKVTNSGLVSIVPHSISSTIDSGFVICGSAISSATVSGPNQHAFAAKLTKNGVLSWFKTLGTSFYGSDAYTIKQTADSGYIFIGGLQNGSSSDWCSSLVKLNKSGNFSWQKKYCSLAAQSNDDLGYDIIEETNGYLCFLNCDSYNSVLLKTDLSGNQIWAKKYSIPSSFDPYSNERPIHLRKISEKNRHITFKGPDSFNAFTMVVDTLGNVQASAYTYYTDIDFVQFKNKNFIMVGNPSNLVTKNSFTTYGQWGVVVTDSLGLGNSVCYLSNNTSASVQSLLTSSVSSTFTNSGSLASIQPTISTLILTDSIGCIAIPTFIKENDLSSTSIYPNPTEGKLTIQSEALKGKSVTFKLYDITGKILLTKELTFEKNEETLDITRFDPSVYFYGIFLNDERIKNGKIIIAK